MKHIKLIVAGVIVVAVVGFLLIKLDERNSYNDIFEFCMSNAETPMQQRECEVQYKANIGQ